MCQFSEHGCLVPRDGGVCQADGVEMDQWLVLMVHGSLPCLAVSTESATGSQLCGRSLFLPIDRSWCNLSEHVPLQYSAGSRGWPRWGKPATLPSWKACRIS